MRLPVKDAIHQAIDKHKQGRLEEAARDYQAILKIQPNNPEINHNLGLIALSQNQLNTAVVLFKNAVDLNPNVEQFWLSYVDALVQSKQPAQAKSVIKKAKKKGHDGKKFSNLLVKSKSVSHPPKPPPEELTKLRSHLENERFHEAQVLAEAIIKVFPKHQFAWKVLGSALRALGRLSESLDVNRTAARLVPTDAEAHNNFGITLQEMGKLKESEASFKKAISLKQDYAKAHFNLGITLHELSRFEEAESCFRQAVKLDSTYVKAHFNLGITLQELGKFEQAKSSLRDVINIEPRHCEAYRLLASMTDFTTRDQLYDQIIDAYRDEDISAEERHHLDFALAKAAEDFGDYEQAFAHFSRGNARLKTRSRYHISIDEERFGQIRSTYQSLKQNALNSETSSCDPVPIFIFGMPRSGTTLVEQIVSAHSDVRGAGELSFVEDFGVGIATGLVEVHPKALISFRENYLEKLKMISGGCSKVTDKMPHNFRYLGLLAAVFPEAKFVHVKRNPAAVCWSNFKTPFVGEDLGYSNSLSDIAKYYQLYDQLMEFWGNAFGDRIYDLDYELLTVDQETVTRKLIETCGLDWDESCLSPENNERAVATASNSQIRTQTYRGSSQQWERYKPFLGDSFDSLL